MRAMLLLKKNGQARCEFNSKRAGKNAEKKAALN
jgi:hypothetical protein